MKEYFVSVPCSTLASGYNVVRFFREEDANERIASEPGAELIDKKTALLRAGGSFDEITSHYFGVNSSPTNIAVSGAWYIDSLPGFVVAELEDGQLVSFPLSPYRYLTDEDLSDYNGIHPRRQHGTPMPAALYTYYGLEKSEEILSEVLRVRLSPSELERVKSAADAAQKTVSEYTRDWIRGL